MAMSVKVCINYELGWQILVLHCNQFEYDYSQRLDRANWFSCRIVWISAFVRKPNDFVRILDVFALSEIRTMVQTERFLFDSIYKSSN